MSAYTEEEARKKWCPFARVADCGSDMAVAANKSSGPMLQATRCIASECMAWRLEVARQCGPHQPPSEWVDEPTGRGYCGLAGAP